MGRDALTFTCHKISVGLDAQMHMRAVHLYMCMCLLCASVVVLFVPCMCECCVVLCCMRLCMSMCTFP